MTPPAETPQAPSAERGPAGPDYDPWGVPAFLAWLLFLQIGLAPVAFFNLLRDAGHVLTQNALINSPWLITLAFAGYVGVFTYRECLSAGQNRPEAQSKATYHVIIGLVAFMALPFDLRLLLALDHIPVLEYRLVVLLVAPMKILAWLYFLLLGARRFLFGNPLAFTRAPILFPSARRSIEEARRGEIVTLAGRRGDEKRDEAGR